MTARQADAAMLEQTVVHEMGWWYCADCGFVTSASHEWAVDIHIDAHEHAMLRKAERETHTLHQPALQRTR